jgi:hypothetical protein
MLCCKACRECVAIGGEATWEPDEDDRFVLQLEPRFMEPPPPFFRLSGTWPESVVDELRAAFSSFWHDLGASANHVRSSIEYLLTAQGIRRFQKTRNGRRHRLGLHDRIDAFKLRSPRQAEALLAVKWIGNAGSHEGSKGLTQDDLFDAFDLLSNVLPEILDGKTTELERLARGITKKRRPRSTWRTRS